jgi:hypothetical protein
MTMRASGTNREDRLDPIVDEVNLSTTTELVPDRALDDWCIELDDVRLD